MLKRAVKAAGLISTGRLTSRTPGSSLMYSAHGFIPALTLVASGAREFDHHRITPGGGHRFIIHTSFITDARRDRTTPAATAGAARLHAGCAWRRPNALARRGRRHARRTRRGSPASLGSAKAGEPPARKLIKQATAEPGGGGGGGGEG